MTNAKDALARAKRNDRDRWIGGGALSARERILSGLVVPMGVQSFTCAPGHTFFAIGSCFARNVEERLELAGADVLSRRMAIRDLGATSGRALGIFNKYTPFSILQELEFAAGERDFPEAGFLPASNDLHYDAQLRASSGEAPIAELTARRTEIRAAFARAFAADVVIVTLGLIEAWYDTLTGLYLTEMPAPRLSAREPHRFEFRVLTVDQCRAALEAIRAILGRHGKAGQRIIVTVSPVALARTFTEHDVVVANTTSKSTLRVAAMEFATTHESVDYFPSYEAVLNSAPGLAWQDDRLHASDFLVGRIIATFLARYGLGTHPDGENGAVGENPDGEAADSGVEPSTVAELRRDVDRYKNRVLALERQLERLAR